MQRFDFRKNLDAQELRDLVDQVKARAKATEPPRGPKPVPLAQPRGELAGLLTAGYPKTRVADMALPEVLGARLERVLTEQRERDRLERGAHTTAVRNAELVAALAERRSTRA
ncbi:MAG: hypothetical protein IPI49_32955 [Myxococcales bacterium]|nr:hypothetical protein [Myxococcales bacterium]